ncbi:MAG: hypothetical protein H6849_00650 [Alphaproteobacteria bacterium]|nr:MAG: hypothetical protein H6849_00650 [Alphaproteobacteria bacterium]
MNIITGGEIILVMVNKQTSSSQPADLLKALPVYGFALFVLTLLWLLTGVGYFWPIWFMIGWLSSSHASDYFQKMYDAGCRNWSALQRHISASEQKTSKKSEGRTGARKSASAPPDETDIAGA